MQLLPLEELGGRVVGRTIQFGVLLPALNPGAGFSVTVRVIHEVDQFRQDVPPLTVALQHRIHDTYGDLWSGVVDLDRPPEGAGPSWGRDGRYVYRLCVNRGNDILDWVIDPFARDFGVGKLSAVVVGDSPFDWGADEAAWRTPEAEDLVFYEVNLAEIARDLPAATARIPYLADLGVNCLQLMPVNNVLSEIDWGYLPSAYFGVDERLGSREQLQRLIAEAHQFGLAVVLDAVYGHTSTEFAFVEVYRHFAIPNNPFMADYAKNLFSESTGFQFPLTKDYFFTVNHLWLDVYHVDGFRYDCVPNYWNGPFEGYGELCYETYQHIKRHAVDGTHWQRFMNNGRINVIQCAEQLEAPVEVLNRTYSSSTWQNETLAAAAATARGGDGALGRLGAAFGLAGYPEVSAFGADVIHQAPLQYIENHDHPRFLCLFGTQQPDSRRNILFERGDRSQWYRIQPYLIGMLTAKGAPLLFQGQELCEDYFLPDDGLGRVALLRPVQWEYFYTDAGQNTLWLVRTLLRLRRDCVELRRGQHFFYNDSSYLRQGILLQARYTDSVWTLIALNVTDQDRVVSFRMQRNGDHHEMLHGQDNLLGVVAGEIRELTVPGNYGRIWRAG
ncbi:MAG: alpha-amylase family glycosyl hydrolase [Pseudonocardiaceae bacterium]